MKMGTMGCGIDPGVVFNPASTWCGRVPLMGMDGSRVNASPATCPECRDAIAREWKRMHSMWERCRRLIINQTWYEDVDSESEPDSK